MKKIKWLKRTVLPVVFLMLTSLLTSAQITNEPPSRSITSQDFQTKRPATIRGGRTKVPPKKPITPVTNQKRRKSIAVVTNPGRRYKFIKRTMIPKTAVPTPTVTNSRSGKTKTKPTTEEIRWEEEELGVTFWRLRPLKKGDEEEDAPTFDVNIGDGVDKWTAERVDSTTRFKYGDRVRFTIEPLRTGYIYIINREVFEDGLKGDAVLIYPNMRARSRQDNLVNAGRLVEIPSLFDVNKYLTITPGADKYIGEELIVVISPTKLTGFSIGGKITSLRSDILQNWLNEWNSLTDIYDASDGEGVAYTRTEEESVRTRSLTQEEPLPQTIYRFKSRVGKPLMISFQMQVRQK